MLDPLIRPAVLSLALVIAAPSLSQEDTPPAPPTPQAPAKEPTSAPTPEDQPQTPQPPAEQPPAEQPPADQPPANPPAPEQPAAPNDQPPADQPKDQPAPNPAPAPAAAPQQPDPAQPAPTDQPAANFRFQFDGMTYVEVIQRFAQAAEKPLVGDLAVEGTLTFFDAQPYTYAEALDTLNLILATKGVMLVESGRFLKLVPLKDLPKLPLKVFRGLDQTGDVRPGEVVTVVLPLKFIDAAEVAQAVTAMLSDAGSVAPVTRGRGLIVTDRLSNIHRIQKLLTELDSESPVQRQMKSYKLVNASGAVVSDLLNRTFGEATAPKRTVFNDATKVFQVLPANPDDYVTSVYDDTSRTLVMFGPADRLDLAEQLVKQFEDTGGSRGGEVRIFHPRATKADDLARIIREAVPGVAQADDKPAAAALKARVIIDAPTNRLIVTAPFLNQLETIEKLIERVDQSTAGPVDRPPAEVVHVTKVIELHTADPAGLATVLTNATSTKGLSGETVARLKVTVDAATKKIVITGSPGDVQMAEEIARQVDTIKPDPRPRRTQIIALPREADAEKLAALVEQLYKDQAPTGPAAPPADAKLLADAVGRRLIVTATDEDVTKIQALVEQVTHTATLAPAQPRQVTVITLKHAQATAAMTTVQKLIDEQADNPPFADQPKPLVLGDEKSNRLLVTATEAQKQAIEQMVAQIDVEPATPVTARSMRVFALKQAKADELLPVLTKLLAPAPGPDGTTPPTDGPPPPTVIADPTGTKVIVVAAEKQHEQVAALIEQLDQVKPIAPRGMKTIALHGQKAADLAPLVQQVYDEQLKGSAAPAGGPATVTADARANRLIVTGPEAEVTRIEQIVSQLDPTDEKPSPDQTRVIRLKVAKADVLAGLVEKSLPQEQGRESVKVQVDAASNSLVLTGTAEVIESAAKIVEQLDAAPPRQPRELRIVGLESADAATVAAAVEQLFAEQMRDEHGPNYVSATKITADPTSNRLILTGPKDDLDRLAEMIQKLDQPSAQPAGARVFSLKSADAKQVAEVIAKTMVTYNSSNTPIQRVSVSADAKTNSVVVSGSPQDLAAAAVIIENLDKGAPAQRQRVVRMIELPGRDGDAASLTPFVTLANQVWQQQSAGREGAEMVTITADPAGKRVIVVSPADLIEQVEALIAALHQPPPSKAGEVHLIDVDAKLAATLLPTLREIYQQQVKPEEAATINLDPTGKRLIVVGSADQAAKVRELVAKLAPAEAPSARATRVIDIADPAELERLVPLVRQLYEQQQKEDASGEPADALILSDAATGRLIVSGRQAHLDRIEAIVQKLRAQPVEPKPRQTRIYDLKAASPVELAATVTKLYQEKLKDRPGARADQMLVLPDAATNRLIVTAPADELEQIEPIIMQLDEVTRQTAGTRVFTLKANDAQQVASILSSTLVRINASGTSIPRVSVGADAKSNTLIVSGEPADLQSAAVIIEQLDNVVAAAPRQMRIFPVQSQSAVDLSEKVRQLYMDRMKGSKDADAMAALIIGDAPSGRLIVTATQEQMAVIGEIVSALDAGGVAAGRQLRVFTLKHTAAKPVAAVLSQVFAQQIASARADEKLAVSASPDDRTVVVDASGSAMARVEELVTLLDAAPDGKGIEVRSYQLAEAAAPELAASLAKLFAPDAAGSPVTGPTPRFEADAATNHLIVAASAEQFVRIDELIKQLQAAVTLDSQVKTFHIQHGSAEQMAAMLQSTLGSAEESGGRRRGEPAVPRDAARVSAVASLNAVVVHGPPNKLALAEQLIKAVDVPQREGQAIIQTVRLSRAQAATLAEAVAKAVAARTPPDQAPDVHITPEINSNSVLIHGPAERVAEVMQIIKSLDAESTGGGVDVRIYRLENGKAKEVSAILQQLMQGVMAQQAASGRKAAPPSITIDERTNSVIVSTTAQQFAVIEQLLANLDQRPERDDRDIHYFWLENARAIQVAAQVEAMFADRAEADRPVVEADALDNSLTVIAKAIDAIEIEQLILRIDEAARDRSVQVRIVPTERVPAEQMAKMLHSVYGQIAPGRVEISDTLPPRPESAPAPDPQQPQQPDVPPDAARQKQPPAPIVIVADKQANAILLSGPAHELEQIESLIRRLSASFVAAEAEFRHFTLKEADPVAVAATLTKLFEKKPVLVPQQSGQPPQQVTPPPDITAVAEPRTRSVIVRARPADFAVVEPIIQQLDAAGATAELEFRVFTLQHVPPARALPLLQQATDHIQKLRPGESISVTSDAPSRSLIVVARGSLIEQIEQIIRTIDQPPAFAEAQVVVVPLTKADATQLAAVLQEMLRPGAAGQFTPEAVALQEQVRRLNVRDTQGKAVALDLTRPIKVMADPITVGGRGGNRLIISSTADNAAALEAVAKMMDTVPVVEGVEVELIALKNADATQVATSLTTVFTQGRSLATTSSGPGDPQSGKAVAQPLNAAADLRTNTLVISGHPESVALAKRIVADLDRQTDRFVTEVKLFHLKHAAADRLTPLLLSVFAEQTAVPGTEGLNTQVTRLRAAIEGEDAKQSDQPKSRAALSIQADQTTNMLIVAARSDIMPIITDVVNAMDIPAAGGLSQVRFFPLNHGDAVGLQQVITNLYAGANGDRIRPEDRPVVTADPRTNTLVVAGNDKAFAIVTGLVQQLDVQPADPALRLTVIGLQHNDATAVASTLNALFTARLAAMTTPTQPPAPKDRVNVAGDALTNALIVSAGPENLELIQGLVAKIDAEPIVKGGQLEVFALRFTDAQRAANMLRSLVQQGIYRPGLTTTDPQQAARERIAIAIDPRTNALIVSAGPENLAVVRQVIQQIDAGPFAEVGDVRVYTLKHASAPRLAQTLELFYRQKRIGEGLVGDPEGLVPVVVVADDRTNSLIVTGSRESFDSIDRMVAQLDTASFVAQSEYRVVPIKQATAVKLQTTLANLFAQRPAPPGGGAPQPIVVVTDTLSNTLIVGASREDLPMVERLIEQLDVKQPDRDVTVIPVAKANAQRIAETIRGLYQETAAAPGANAASVVVNVDERLNALIVSAGEEDARRIERLVKQLDTDQVSRVSELRVFPLQHARATDLATLMNEALNTQPTPLTEQSPNRQTLLQFITRTGDDREMIASALKEGVLITPDTRTNSLVVTAPVDNMPLLEQVVRKLDSASAQVAKIRVFPLANADARQMADVLLELFRLQQAAGAGASGERSIRYFLDSRSGDNAEAPPGEKDAATVGSADQYALTITVDLRTNSILVGGTEHYVGLVSEIIEELDSSPAQERRSQVYRLKNAQAADVEAAIRSFLDQDRQRVAQILGTEAVGTMQRLLEREVAIVAEPSSNTLLLSASPRFFDHIADLIQDLDLPQPQVLIQVMLAEVTLDDQTDLGIDWSLRSMVDGASVVVGQDFGTATALRTMGGFSTTVTGGDFDFLLRALQAEGRLEVLSRPQILAADNKQALINIGQQVPLVTTSRVTDEGDTINTFEYRPVGVELDVTPRISPDGFVSLEVSPNVSSLSSSNVDVSPGVEAPIINERRATTTVSVQNGHTIIIGGLISTSDDQRVKRVPLLSDLPFVGGLFKSTTTTSERKELLIILTPHVLTNVQDARKLTDDALRNSDLQRHLNRDAMQRRLLNEVLPEPIPEDRPLEPLPGPEQELPAKTP